MQVILSAVSGKYCLIYKYVYNPLLGKHDYVTCDNSSYLSIAKNRAMLQKAQFFAVCGEEWIFENTEEALQHARHGSRLVNDYHHHHHAL